MEAVIAFLVANPEVVALLLPVAGQAASWVVKKSPWGWDDTLLGWMVKNRAGLTLLKRYLNKR